MRSVVVEGQTIPGILLQVEKQPEVGTSAYDKGARQLTDFFHKELTQFLEALGAGLTDSDRLPGPTSGVQQPVGLPAGRCAHSSFAVSWRGVRCPARRHQHASTHGKTPV
jgi:hypothetical protein